MTVMMPVPDEAKYTQLASTLTAPVADLDEIFCPVPVVTSVSVYPSDGTLSWCTVLEKPFEVEALLAALVGAATGAGATLRAT